MDLTLHKTLTFLLFIGIGLLLKLKFQSKEELGGIKKIILNLALPATIFIALLGITIDGALVSLPFMALSLNLILFIVFPYLIPFTGIGRDNPNYRTAKLLVPSLAPGLSCFPFILEFLGQESLAKAAMADLGNKVFVLIVLYVIAMNWFYRKKSSIRTSRSSKLKSLIITMVCEPVNLFICMALALVFFGLTMESLPVFINDALSRLSFIMTPLVLLYIGLAVSIKTKQFIKLASLLLLRAGFVAVLCGLFVFIANIKAQTDILVLLSFGLSACSFWPFSHISLIDAQEKDVPLEQRTFSTSFAINILALSFPLSTLLILAILSSGSLFSSAIPILILGGTLMAVGMVPYLAITLKLVTFQGNKTVDSFGYKSVVEKY